MADFVGMTAGHTLGCQSRWLDETVFRVRGDVSGLCVCRNRLGLSLLAQAQGS